MFSLFCTAAGGGRAHTACLGIEATISVDKNYEAKKLS